MPPFPTNSQLGTTFRVIDISDKPVESEVLRNGNKIPALMLDEDRVANIIAADLLDDITVQPRVVYQSISSGTRIPRGTSVDIVLASPFLVDVDVIPGAHIDMTADNMGNIAELYLADAEVRQAIGQARGYDDLPPAIRVQLEQTASDNNVGLVQGTPGQDNQALFNVLQAANTYS